MRSPKSRGPWTGPGGGYWAGGTGGRGPAHPPAGPPPPRTLPHPAALAAAAPPTPSPATRVVSPLAFAPALSTPALPRPTWLSSLVEKMLTLAGSKASTSSPARARSAATSAADANPGTATKPLGARAAGWGRGGRGLVAGARPRCPQRARCCRCILGSAPALPSQGGGRPWPGARRAARRGRSPSRQKASTCCCVSGLAAAVGAAPGPAAAPAARARRAGRGGARAPPLRAPRAAAPLPGGAAPRPSRCCMSPAPLGALCWRVCAPGWVGSGRGTSPRPRVDSRAAQEGCGMDRRVE
jgi:hypothetical protein